MRPSGASQPLHQKRQQRWKSQLRLTPAAVPEVHNLHESPVFVDSIIDDIGRVHQPASPAPPGNNGSHAGKVLQYLGVIDDGLNHAARRVWIVPAMDSTISPRSFSASSEKRILKSTREASFPLLRAALTVRHRRRECLGRSRPAFPHPRPPVFPRDDQDRSSRQPCLHVSVPDWSLQILVSCVFPTADQCAPSGAPPPFFGRFIRNANGATARHAIP
jgi:hypothetical protein